MFFHYQTVKHRFQELIITTFETTKTSYSEMTCLMIYGELFGGHYPHPDVPSDFLVQAIQTGIYYTPSIEFCAFDLAIINEQKHTFLDYNQSINIFKKVGLFYAMPLFVGEYSKAMDYPIPSESTIPAQLDLPPLFERNPAEGIVIKPMQTIYIHTNKGLSRPILKKKIPSFSEKQFHQATKWINQSTSISILDQLEWNMFALITENRLNNVLSKLGYRQTLTNEVIIPAFCEDVWEQLSDENPIHLETMTQEEIGLLKAILADEVKAFIQQNSKHVG